METEKLDIVYTIKDQPENEELRYSLRSLENLPHGKVWLYGGCPKWVNKRTIRHIYYPQEGPTKWTKTSSLLREICQNENITENFIWFNDDFFVLQEQETLNYYKDRTLTARVLDFAKLGWHQINGAYQTRLKQASRALKFKNCESDNFELHIPMIFNRKQLLDIMTTFPGVGAKRSLYGNYYRVESEQRNDVKIYNLTDKPDKTWDFVSTTDESFSRGEVGKYVKKQFKNKSKYEKG